MRLRTSALVLTLATLGSVAAVAAPNASAGTYTVDVCSVPGEGGALLGGGDGISITSSPGSSNFVTQNDCGVRIPLAEGVRQAAAEFTASGDSRWTLDAAPGTKIKTFSAARATSGSNAWHPDIVWEVTTSSGTQLDKIARSDLPVSTSVEYTVEGGQVNAALVCQRNPCINQAPSQLMGNVDLSDIVAKVEDKHFPTVSLSPPSTPLRGTVQIPFHAVDEGAGIAAALMTVDHIFRSESRDDNGGKCHEPYRFMEPCKLDRESSFPLDTTELSDGVHTLKAFVGDAASNISESAEVSVTVHNAPTNTARPLLAGPATVGSTLTTSDGKWDGAPSSFAYQWLRCPATVKSGEEAGCQQITGATGPKLVLATADLGKREVARVTATNATGPEPALSLPSAAVAEAPKPEAPKAGVDTAAPVLSAVSLSRRRFRLGRAPTALAARAEVARGTVLRFSSSEAGTLSVAITRLRAAGKKKAKALKPLATLTRTIGAGAGHLAFSGRIARKPLRPGRYALSLTATDAAGNASTPTRLAVTILAG
jgi:hypothetical protein